MSTIKEETSTDMLVSKEDLVWDGYDENHRNGKSKLKSVTEEVPKETPKENTYSSLGKNGKAFSNEEKPRRNILNGTKSLPSPRKLDFETNGATNQHTPKKTGIAPTDGIEKDEIQEEE